MRMTYDKIADAAYIYVKDSIGPGEAKRTYDCEKRRGLPNGMINIDFDKDGKMLGIEIIPASNLLPKEVLDAVKES